MRDRIARLSDGLAGAMDDVSAELSDTGHPSRLYKEISEQSQSRLTQLISNATYFRILDTSLAEPDPLFTGTGR